MTKNEIIKAVLCCRNIDCDNCPFSGDEQCNEKMLGSAANLLNSMKLEIERLNEQINGRNPGTKQEWTTSDESKGNRLTELDAKIILAIAKNGMKVKRASDSMHYTRRTVEYHLAKIRRITGLNAKDFYDLCGLVEIVRKGYGGAG